MSTQQQIRVSRSGTPNPLKQTARAIVKAEKLIRAVVYKLDHVPILTALEEALGKGVEVRLLVDRWQVECPECGKSKRKNDSLIRSAADAGAKVRVWTEGKLHTKFTIIDQALVLTGSYNWTTGATKKNTELLIESQDEETVKRFGELFQELWKEDTVRRA